MSTISDFLMVTTPYLPGYKVKKVLGLASGLTARTRGFGGKFVAGFQSLAGGEVTAFHGRDGQGLGRSASAFQGEWCPSWGERCC